MRKISIGIFLFFCIHQTISAEDIIPERFKIQAEYKNDTIDYDNLKKNYFREKVKIFLSKDSSFNFAHMYVDIDDENRYTWNLSLPDVSPVAGIILGNYYVNFGSGLLIGKKAFISSDLFSSKLVVSTEKSFTPSNSGNPLFSYNGIAFDYSEKFEFAAFSINSFYSIRNRYISEESYVSGCVDSSLNSINYRAKKEYNYKEPVRITDYGIMLNLSIWKSFTLQVYYFHTDIKGGKNNNILWDYKMKSYQGGVKNLYGCGFFAQYSDGYFVLFLEYGQMLRDIISDEKELNRVNDYGTICGIRFKHPFFAISMTGKKTGEEFYSPYSSGKGYPERAWIFKNSIRPVKAFILGSSFSSEKKLSPGYSESYLSGKRGEQLYIIYNFSRYERCNLKFSRVERDSDIDGETRIQLKSSGNIKFCNFFEGNMTAVFQYYDTSGLSWAIGVGSEISFFRYFRLLLNYSRFMIAKNNSIYARIAPNANSISSGFFVSELSNMVISKISFKYGSNTLQVRYQHQFLLSKSIRNKVELFGRLLF